MLDSHDERVFQHDGGTQVKGSSVTGQLVELGSQLTCWTGRSTVAQPNIATTLDEFKDRHTEKIEAASELKEEIDKRAQRLGEEVEADDDGTSEVFESHREANGLEFELGQLKSDLDSVTEETQVIKEQHDEEIGDELINLWTRIDQIEREAIEQFNEHVAAILELLAYENLDCIWIEWVNREVQEDHQTVEGPSSSSTSCRRPTTARPTRTPSTTSAR